MECDCTKNSWRCQPRISTHALTWSATISPRPTNKPPHISTHALTWSATCVFVPGSHFNCGFQLTHSRGVRHSSGFPCSTDISFQLTHSRGVRHPTARKLLTDGNFNSRTHVECDSKYCIKKRFTTQYMGIYCFLSSIILIFFIYSKK